MYVVVLLDRKAYKMNIIPNVKCVSNYATKAKKCVKKTFLPVLMGITASIGAGYCQEKACGAKEPFPENIYNAAAERYATYKGLAEHDIDILPYLGNYGKAQAALDSVYFKKYGLLHERGMNGMIQVLESMQTEEHKELTTLFKQQSNSPETLENLKKNIKNLNKSN